VPWLVIGLVLGLGGIGFLGYLVFRLFRQVLRLGRDVGRAATRLGELQSQLDGLGSGAGRR
jgi:hypothetical protein